MRFFPDASVFTISAFNAHYQNRSVLIYYYQQLSTDQRDSALKYAKAQPQYENLARLLSICDSNREVIDCVNFDLLLIIVDYIIAHTDAARALFSEKIFRLPAGFTEAVLPREILSALGDYFKKICFLIEPPSMISQPRI